MPVIPTYPGVYIEELSSLALSVSSSATAVPAFAVDKDDLIFTTPTRVSSWMDYLNCLGSVGFDPASIRDISIRTYFENGGGYCYLVPVDQMVVEVPKRDDVTLVVAAGQDIRAVVTTLCVEGANLFAILDGPEGELSPTDITWKDDYDATEYAAIYYPWLTAKWADIDVPPSAAIAGVYCQNDRTRGVWKAPANESLLGGVLPLYKVTDDLQGQYTHGEKALNMIRQFNNGSPLVWGARTCVDTDAWRYVPVRRLFNSAENDIQNTMKFVMFEPNSQPTWERVRAAITNYLYSLWQQGGLAGATAAEAFFVQVGKDITMTQDDINQGKMIVKVGMAAVRPAEFIILQFTQDVTQ